MLDLDPNQQIPNADKQTEVSEDFTGGEHESMKDAIMFDGRYYRYKSYRYDLLSDARNYARLDVTRSETFVEVGGVGDYGKWAAAEKPTAAERQTMADLNITFDGRCYRYEGYRYDRFADAINYAQLKRRRIQP